MKTKNSLLKCLAIGSLGLSLTVKVFGADYTAHEWGTFTSVQGGDGELLSWRPLKTSDLPSFVYNWSKPGLNRYSGSTFDSSTPLLKTALITLQRMETPVIYFYSAKPMSVDVSVAFPKGSITEWYPQAAQIGPSVTANTNAASGALSESRAVWKNLQLVPLSKLYGSLEYAPPENKSGSHYFAARNTGASIVREDFTDQTNVVKENEKFIFYRGVGNFKTPLQVMVNTNDAVTIVNNGAGRLSHVFLMSIHNGHGAFTKIDELTTNYVLFSDLKSRLPFVPMNEFTGSNSIWPAKFRSLTDVAPSPLSEKMESYPLNQFQTEISKQMESALTSEGLFPEEAKAMVNTWKDSWFTEEGDRVLYILPRTWTDETLPMTLNPKPKSLVRVMVGRAEVITPDAEMNLFQSLTKAQNGDAAARIQATAQLKQLGRFAEPALQLANRHVNQTNIVTLGFELLNGSAPSKFE